jgi:oligosaccharide translocation protein RFT1
MSVAQSKVLAKSARGATFLILLQVLSRALTFIVNQILLRYLSPELLGISSQLELYTITVLTFARESLRVAQQRQGGEIDPERDEKSNENRSADEKSRAPTQSYAPARRAQEGVNLSYISIGLGPPLALTFAWIYIRKADPLVVSTSYIQKSLALFAFATTLELLIEPCFVVAQQQLLYGLRAAAEGSATTTRCILTCAISIWASKSNQDLGVLPFAIGQLGFAVVLNIVYYSNIWTRSTKGGFSLTPRSLIFRYHYTSYPPPSLPSRLIH